MGSSADDSIDGAGAKSAAAHGDVRAERGPLVPAGEMDLHRADLTATFSAEVTLGQAQAALAAIEQWLAIDGDPQWPLGLLAEVNSTGPLRLGYGAWRDLLLGCQFVPCGSSAGQTTDSTQSRPSPRLITAGGRTVKNVAGYDLTKLMIGQCGRLGRMVTLTLRTYRRPTAALIARFEAAGAAGTIARLLPTPYRPQWAALTPEGLWCGYLGDERTIAYYRQELEKVRGNAAAGPGGNAIPAPADVAVRSIEDDRAHRAALWGIAGHERTFRASVPPARIQDFTANAALDHYAADAAFGIVIGRMEGLDPAALAAAARSVGGQVRTFGAGGTSPDAEPARGPEALMTLLRRLEEAFDPARAEQ